MGSLTEKATGPASDGANRMPDHAQQFRPEASAAMHHFDSLAKRTNKLLELFLTTVNTGATLSTIKLLQQIWTNWIVTGMYLTRESCQRRCVDPLDPRDEYD
jgi:hypothetical protein